MLFGWQLASHMRTDLVLDPLRMAIVVLDPLRMAIGAAAPAPTTPSFTTPTKARS